MPTKLPTTKYINGLKQTNLLWQSLKSEREAFVLSSFLALFGCWPAQAVRCANFGRHGRIRNGQRVQLHVRRKLQLHLFALFQTQNLCLRKIDNVLKSVG